MMIPNRIKQYFLLTDQRQNGENTLVSGRLQCCEQPTFSFSAAGTDKLTVLRRFMDYGVEEVTDTTVPQKALSVAELLGVEEGLLAAIRQEYTSKA